ncbi:MAG: M6 family metalloprotease domain-containing protein [Bacteroidales bacterium]|nr:M6 family metalloprotease domain-containing protein [Bacteroidales bacterium]
MRKLLAGIFFLVFSASFYFGLSANVLTHRKTVVIPVQFLDVRFTKTRVKVRVDSLFNTPGYNSYGSAGSVSDYFKDNVVGKNLFTFYITDVVTLPRASSFYGEDAAFNTDVNISQMVEEACKAAQKAGVDFSKYDSNNDGEVDHVFIFFAGYNQAESGVSDDIMPQLGDISSRGVVLDGKRIASYGCYSENSGGSGASFAGPGTICHELSHLLGLLDFYDVNGSTEGLSDGLYRTTSLMDYGNFNNNGRTPPYLNAPERDLLDILVTEEARIGEHYVLDPIWKSNKALIIPTAVPNEYFLREYRDGKKWDGHIGGKGLLVYHIDKSNEYAGYLRANIRWALNAINCAAEHPCATLFDAVGHNRLSEMFYPAAASSILSKDTRPLTCWNGTGVGIGLENIMFTPDGRISFDVVEDIGWKIPSVANCKTVVNQRDAYLEWTQTKDYPKDNWMVIYGRAGVEARDTLAVEGKKCRIEDLIPGQTYHCSIAMTDDGFVGKSYDFDFNTIPEISSYPLIAELKPFYNVGDAVDLRVINLNEDILYEQWYVNGIEYNQKNLTFTLAGTYTIHVVYSLDNEDYYHLEKKVTVR